MDLHHIRYFLAVSETLNFTRAAEVSGVTQPALSRAIQQLEDEVGGLLFRRERNLTHMTDLGLLMKPALQRVLARLEKVKTEARKLQSLDRTSVKLGMMCTIGPTRFTGMLNTLYESLPDLSLKLVEGTPGKLMQLLQSGAIDCAVMAQPESFDDEFDVTPLFKERFVVAFPPGHRFSEFDTVSLADVNGEDYLDRISCEYNSHIDEKLADQNCNLKVVYQSEREDWIQNMTAAGLGISLMPEFSATIPGLQTRPISAPEIWRQVSLVTTASMTHSATIDGFVQSLRIYPWPQSRFAGALQVA